MPQPTRQFSAGHEQLGLGSMEAYPEHFSDFFVGESIQHIQIEDRTITFRQAGDQMEEVAHFRVLGSHVTCRHSHSGFLP